MFLGYNTNGMAHHDLFDAVGLLAEIGYRGVAITIDHDALPPHGRLRQPADRAACAACSDELGCGRSSRPARGSCSNPAEKHEPTLISASAADAQRIDFYQATPSIARPNWAATASRSGRACCARGVDRAAGPGRLIDGLAAGAGLCRPPRAIAVAFEPEPGMLDRLDARRSRRCCLGSTPLTCV